MDKRPWVSAEALTRDLHGMVDGLAESIMESMNAARPGHLINETEEPVRQAGHEFLRAAFEAAIPQKINAAEAAAGGGLTRRVKCGKTLARRFTSPAFLGHAAPSADHDDGPADA